MFFYGFADTKKWTATPLGSVMLPASGVSRRTGARLERARSFFFLECHQGLGTLGSVLEPGDQPLLLDDFAVARINLARLATTLLRRQANEFGLITLPAPRREIRRIQPFRSKQGRPAHPSPCRRHNRHRRQGGESAGAVKAGVAAERSEGSLDRPEVGLAWAQNRR